MGLIEYRESKSLSGDGSFYAPLVMAAMYTALKAAFPEVWEEFQKRVNAPGGCLNDAEIEWLRQVLFERDSTADNDESE